MTDQETKSPNKYDAIRTRRGACAIGIVFAVSSLLFFSMAKGFLKGVESYFWTQAEGTVISNDLRYRGNSGDGTVTYTVVAAGREITRTEVVFERWSGGNKKEKYDDWSSAYAVGKPVRIFYASDDRTSLGHWPTEYSWNGFTGLLALFAGIFFFLRGLKQRKANMETVTNLNPPQIKSS